MNNIRRTKITANIGKTMAITDIIKAIIFSILANILLPKPAVETVDVNRDTLDVPLIADAVPPPAIIAKVHVNTGLNSEMVETITKVPAIVANGMAMLSKTLSTTGM